MPNFCVKFFKTLCSSSGHPFKVLQRTVNVRHSKTAEDASHAAHRDFERLEGVSDWRLHADCCEVENKTEKAAANHGR